MRCRLLGSGRGRAKKNGFTSVVILVNAEADAELIVEALESGEAHRIEDLVVLEAFLPAPYAHDIVQ